MFSIKRLQLSLQIEHDEALEMLGITLPMIEESISSLMRNIDRYEPQEIAFKVHTLNGRLQYSGCENIATKIGEFDLHHKTKVNSNIPYSLDELSFLKMTLLQTDELLEAKKFLLVNEEDIQDFTPVSVS